MSTSRKNVRPDRLAQVTSPIKYITENGFSIVRLSEIDSSVTDTPRECRFLVEDEHGLEREVKVEFTEDLILRIRIKRRIPLSASSKFWLTCGEKCLATYLWENGNFPLNERLTISDLYVDELLLAMHWRD